MKRSKFNKELLIAGTKQKNAFSKKQKHMRKKYHIEEKEVVIVEKSNTLKFLITSAARIIYTASAIVMIGLAVTGMAALIYPGPRLELSLILTDMIEQIKSYLGG